MGRSTQTQLQEILFERLEYSLDSEEALALHLDSLGLVDFLMACENYFQLEIVDELLRQGSPVTLLSLSHFIQAKRGESD